MNTLVIDTFQAVSRLKARGFTEEQARGVTETLQDIDLSQIATKQDIQTVRQEIQSVKQEFQAALLELKADLFKWLVPLLLGQAALIAALGKLL